MLKLQRVKRTDLFHMRHTFDHRRPSSTATSHERVAIQTPNHQPRWPLRTSKRFFSSLPPLRLRQIHSHPPTLVQTRYLASRHALVLWHSSNRISLPQNILIVTSSGTMSLIFTIAITPFVLCLTIPLFISAALTSFLAFITLAVRLILVYIELAFSVLHQQLSSSLRPPKTPIAYTNWVKSNPYEWDFHPTPNSMPTSRPTTRRAPSFSKSAAGP